MESNTRTDKRRNLELIKEARDHLADLVSQGNHIGKAWYQLVCEAQGRLQHAIELIELDINLNENGGKNGHK